MQNPIVAALMESHRRPRTLSEMKVRETEQQFRTRVVKLLKRPILSEMCFRKDSMNPIPCDDTFVTKLLEAVDSTDGKYSSKVNSTERVTYRVDTYPNTTSPYIHGMREILDIYDGGCSMTKGGIIARLDEVDRGTTVICVEHNQIGLMEVCV
jgi:hypothetical protein